jgi:hypothetical protein
VPCHAAEHCIEQRKRSGEVGSSEITAVQIGSRKGRPHQTRTREVQRIYHGPSKFASVEIRIGENDTGTGCVDNQRICEYSIGEIGAV